MAAKSWITNASNVEQGINVLIRRVSESYVAEYRNFVWAVFVRLLYHTPQYTGQAAASWTIGLGAPDYNVVPYRSDVDKEEALEKWADNLDMADYAREIGQRMPMKAPRPDNVREVGDRRAIDAARRRNAWKIPLIKRDTKVYFTNAAWGDMESDVDQRFGFSGPTFYLEALQKPDYWAAKLRAENSGAERIQETIAFMKGRFARLAGNNGTRFGVGEWERWV